MISTVANQIRSKILLTGPIPVAEYMKMALTSTFVGTGQVQGNQSGGGGYYMGKDVFGASGDFITSPEISQLFGEMVGVWGLDTWYRIGGPKTFNIVELGPGRGTLAKDLLRVFRQVTKNTNNPAIDVRLHLVEISPHLAKLQAQTLCQPTGGIFSSFSSGSRRLRDIDPMKNTAGNSWYHSDINQEFQVPVYWYRDLASVPKGFNFYIAHEFLDALPIHKLQKTDLGQWREVLIDIDHSNNTKFRYVISRSETPVIKILQSRYDWILFDNRPQLEISIEAFNILEQLCDRLDESGGLALLIDYGHNGSKFDTFRGFSKHRLVDPLFDPGSVDLTADVDWSVVEKICREKAVVLGPISQKNLLSRVGINVRLRKLLEKCNKNEHENLISGYKMLMESMGERFSCLALLPYVLQDFRPNLKIAAFDE